MFFRKIQFVFLKLRKFLKINMECNKKGKNKLCEMTKKEINLALLLTFFEG